MYKKVAKKRRFWNLSAKVRISGLPHTDQVTTDKYLSLSPLTYLENEKLIALTSYVYCEE